MNFIENIEIKNFKSIRHQKIEGCKRVNVFIGYPNVGKSNILEALGLFSLRENQKDNVIELRDILRLDELSQMFFNGDITSDIEIRISHYFITKIRHLNVGCSFEIYSEEKQKGTIAPIIPENINKKERIVLFQGNLNTPSKEMEISENFIINKVRAKEIIPIRRYLFNQKPIPKTRASLKYLSIPSGDNISGIIFSIPEIKEDVKELFEKYGLFIATSSETTEIKLLKRLNDGTYFILDFKMIADTLQRLIFYKAAIHSNKNAVLLFEEPEAHMFPPYVKKFTTDVILDETNQFFIATHSPCILEEFIEEIETGLAVYVVDYDKGETIIKRLTDEQVLEVAQYGIDLFFNLEPYLDKYGQQHSA